MKLKAPKNYKHSSQCQVQQQQVYKKYLFQAKKLKNNNIHKVLEPLFTKTIILT